MKAPTSKDFYAGLLFMAFGGVAFVTALNYDMGSAAAMGPAYFPVVLGALLILLGLYMAVRDLVKGGDPLGLWTFRPLLLLVAALAFGLLVEPLGFVISVVAVIFGTTYSGGSARFLETLIVSICAVVATAALFIYGLSMPFTLWPSIWN